MANRMAERDLVVASINVGVGRRALTGKVDIDRLARQTLDLLAAQPVDVIAIQEAFRVWGASRESFLDFGQELARQLGPPYRSFFAPYLDSDVHSHSRKWQRDSYRGLSRAMQGNAIVSRLPIARWPWPQPNSDYPGCSSVEALNVAINAGEIFSSGDRNTEPKTVCVVPLVYGTSEIYVIAAHLSTLTNDDRRSAGSAASVARCGQVRALHRIKAQLAGSTGGSTTPLVLACDANAVLDSPEMKLLLQEFQTSRSPRWDDGALEPIWSHVDHRVLIDHIFWSNALENIDYFVAGRTLLSGKTDSTDHLPIIARFRRNG